MYLSTKYEDFNNACADEGLQDLPSLLWRNPISTIILAKVAVTTAVKALIGGD
jgi:hypothetical protein